MSDTADIDGKVDISDTAHEIRHLLSKDQALSLDEIVAQTSLESETEAKAGLRELLDIGVITTTPGFKYRLTRNHLTDKYLKY